MQQLFTKNQQVLYCANTQDAVIPQDAVIIAVHDHDAAGGYYTIKVSVTGTERQTVPSKLRRKPPTDMSVAAIKADLHALGLKEYAFPPHGWGGIVQKCELHQLLCTRICSLPPQQDRTGQQAKAERQREQAGAERQRQQAEAERQRQQAEAERQRQQAEAERQRQQAEAVRQRQQAEAEQRRQQRIPPELLVQQCGYSIHIAREFQECYGFRMCQWAEAVQELREHVTAQQSNVFISPKDLANHCGYPVWSVKDFQQLYGFKRHQWAEAVCELHQYATSLEH